MTPEERRLVEDLFHRIDRTRAPIEDGEADTLIRQALAERPTLAYRLVQHAVLQEVALREAKRRIADLQSHPGQGGGSFLGRLFGGDPVPPPRPAGAGRSRDAAGSPGSAYRSGPPGTGAGGFLRAAATTAAGVAAGGLLFSGLEHLFGGGPGGFGARPEEVVQNDTVINEYLDPAASGSDDSGADSLTSAADPLGWPGDPGGDPLADAGGWVDDPTLGDDALLGGGGPDGGGFDGLGGDDGDWS